MVEGAVGTSVLSPRPVSRGNAGSSCDQRGPVYHIDLSNEIAVVSQGGPKMTPANEHRGIVLEFEGEVVTNTASQTKRAHIGAHMLSEKAGDRHGSGALAGSR